MKTTLNWLKKHIEFSENNIFKLLQQIELNCIKHGMELDDIQLINPILQAQIKEVNNIEGLKVKQCIMDLSPFENLIQQPNIVLCGGSNPRPNMYTLMCPVGTTLHNGIKIEERKIKTHMSYGMLLSKEEANVHEKDLNAFPSVNDGILDINTSESKIYSYEDICLTFKVPFHRWDLHCTRGIARALSECNMGQFLPLKQNTQHSFQWNISVNNQTETVFTFGEIKNIKIDNQIIVLMKNIGKHSENHMQLLNDFILIDIGHPIAIYDKKHIDQINIKKFVDNTINIENSREIICKGGIKNTLGYNHNSTHVIIEAGYFHKNNINSLETHSAYMFWLGIDNNQMTMEYIYSLIQGEKSNIYYGNGIMPTSQTIELPLGDVYKYTNISLSGNEIIELLNTRNFKCTMCQTTREDNVNNLICVKCVCPSWRKDIILPIDIVEEITKIISYDSIKTQNNNNISIENNSLNYIEQIKLQLCTMGLNEIYKFPFTNKQGPIKIQNPINQQEPYMRNTLFYNMCENIHEENWENKFFTYDKIYNDKGEFLKLGILINGKTKRFWNGKSTEFDFYFIKQIIHSLNISLNLNNSPLPSFASHGLTYEEGYICKIKNSILLNTYYAEIDINHILKIQLNIDHNKTYNDISITCDKSTLWKYIEKALKGYDFYLFDIYESHMNIKYGITFINTKEIPHHILNKFKYI